MIRIQAALAVLVLSFLASMPATAQTPGPADPFAAFMGDWTLRDDRFQQVWDGHTVETVSIPNHHTHCAPINTTQSVLCVVTAGDLKGHILWAYDAGSGRVHHLSHFGTARLGTGEGRLSAAGDLNLKLHFTDEPEGSYRIYDYRWIDADTYEMISQQYAGDGVPTGNWYGGIFVRMKQADRDR